ncbi:uncharacterized protein LOC127241908 [Andrographis paniculata]|uniref:uncharacterized protein LOC127241908 n=1 Tax=Andrographis paniculata TaxID=175694 RepID=UPI0021E8B8EC|nr:uncharacterized protein LOC127241908 [Andrographis paniculata]XP_051117134.1 uncharacterized protein LOC127241908 [Andrographis paniculata]
MRRNSGSVGYSGAHTSPGTPEYGDGGEFPKPWSSERVPLPASSSSSRRHISAAALMPFNSGRTLPSKWDDAERWITSPISGHGLVRTPVAQPQRRPKSKSGPLGLPGIVYESRYSPTMPGFDAGGNPRKFMEHSPLTTGVFVPDGVSIRYGSSIVAATKCVGDDKVNDAAAEEEESPAAAGDVRRRDSATQMSPEGSGCSSSDARFSFSAMPSTTPAAFAPPAVKDEVRDVQVDRGTTTSSHGKQSRPRKAKKTPNNAESFRSSPWNASEASKDAAKMRREEAKIAAWENLQKAKAEAAIRELEMRLEKKRSASMDKIMRKLRASQMKAESMRNSLSENREDSDKASGSGSGSGSSSSSSRRMFVNVLSVRNWFVCRRN